MDKHNQAFPFAFETYPLPLLPHRQSPKGDFERTERMIEAPCSNAFSISAQSSDLSPLTSDPGLSQRRGDPQRKHRTDQALVSHRVTESHRDIKNIRSENSVTNVFFLSSPRHSFLVFTPCSKSPRSRESSSPPQVYPPMEDYGGASRILGIYVLKHRDHKSCQSC
jgi:hypothetical protein